MSFRRHKDCINSGVAWLGDVPSHWDVVRLRRLVEIKKEISGELGYDVFSVTQNGFRIKDTESGEGQQSLDYSKYQFVKVGQFGMNPMDLLTGGADIATTVGVTSPDYRVFEIRNAKVVHDRYMLYMLQMLYRNHIFYAFGQGSSQLGRWRLPRQQFNDLQFPVPPIDEQKAISSFLDVETSKIDGLVSEQRRLIELLKEKRQAVISHAVTKGLNPNAPMKPSGIQWLGDVPQHWSVVPLKRVARVNTGVAKGKDHADKKTVNVPYLRVANVQDGYLDLETITTIDILEHELERYRLVAGDVLMNEGGDFDKLGRGHIWEGQIDPCITQNHVFAVRPTAVPSHWLSRITSSDYAQFYFMTRSNQSTNLASISTTNLMKLPVILPPECEQKEILEFISQSTDKFDGLLAEAERAIELLQERRTALISAAVTGKIDVREFAYQEAV